MPRAREPDRKKLNAMLAIIQKRRISERNPLIGCFLEKRIRKLLSDLDEHRGRKPN